MFRDHLRANPQVRDDYFSLKQDLAARFRDDRDAYSKLKTHFIDTVVLSLGGPSRKVDWNR